MKCRTSKILILSNNENSSSFIRNFIRSFQFRNIKEILKGIHLKRIRSPQINLHSLNLTFQYSLCSFNFNRTVVVLHSEPMSELKCGRQLHNGGSLIAMIIRQRNIRHQSRLPGEPQTSHTKLLGEHKLNNVFHKLQAQTDIQTGM